MIILRGEGGGGVVGGVGSCPCKTQRMLLGVCVGGGVRGQGWVVVLGHHTRQATLWGGGGARALDIRRHR